MRNGFRLVLLLAILASSIGVIAGKARAHGDVASTGHLVVADPAAETLYVYDLPNLEVIARFDQTVLADHAGYLALPDGRLLFVEAKTSELVALDLEAEDGPAIVGRVPVPGVVSHIAVDPTATYAVVGASDELRPLTLVDLRSYTSRSFDVEAGEVGIMLGGDPLMLFHRNDVLMQVEGYPVEALMRGEVTPTGVVATGAAGHGEGISHALNKLVMATDDGLDIVEIDGSRLAYHATLPWDVSERSGGRAYFLRVSGDGSQVVSYIADRGDAETPWETWTNDAYLADLTTDQAIRVELGPGLVYRFAQTEGTALFFNMHPEGDFAHLLDIDPASATYGTVVAQIPLEPLTKAPKVGESPWEAESRIAAMTPDGALGFVSAGGDGYINLIDIAARKVVRKLETPTDLSGGGYLIAVQPGMELTDTVGR